MGTDFEYLHGEQPKMHRTVESQWFVPETNRTLHVIYKAIIKNFNSPPKINTELYTRGKSKEVTTLNKRS